MVRNQLALVIKQRDVAEARIAKLEAEMRRTLDGVNNDVQTIERKVHGGMSLAKAIDQMGKRKNKVRKP